MAARLTVFLHCIATQRPSPWLRWLSALLVLATCLSLWGIYIPDLRDKALQQFGPESLTTIESWEQLITEQATADVASQLAGVNDFFNQNVSWVEDIEAYESEDYWATPLETMGRGVGDCEDFTIAKYATLALLGVPPETMRLVYVRAKRNGLDQAHMVLAWYPSPNASPLILDNLDYVIRPAHERQDLQPLFSFNGENLWLGNEAAATNQEPTARISRWATVVQRIREDGFTEGF